MRKLFIILAVVSLLGAFVTGVVSAQSIGIGAPKITLPIVVDLAPAGNGLAGMKAHFSINEGGEITCLRGTEAGINDCGAMQTVWLAVADLNDVWKPGDRANIGSITISGISGETKTVWLSVIQADDDDGVSIVSSFAPVAIPVTIP